MAKKVRDAMTPEPRVADPSLSLAEAAELMKSEDIGSLPVVQEGQQVAVLTDRDITQLSRGSGLAVNACKAQAGVAEARLPWRFELLRQPA